MVLIKLQTDVVLNGETLDITVYEDLDNDGTPENHQTVSVANGTNTVILKQLTGSDSADYWFEESYASGGTSAVVINSADLIKRFTTTAEVTTTGSSTTPITPAPTTTATSTSGAQSGTTTPQSATGAVSITDPALAASGTTASLSSTSRTTTTATPTSSGASTTEKTSGVTTQTTAAASTTTAAGSGITSDPYTTQTAGGREQSTASSIGGTPTTSTTAGSPQTTGQGTTIVGPATTTTTSTPTPATATGSGVTATASIHLNAPSSVSTTVDSNEQITVSWADNSGSEDNFRIQIDKNGTGFQDASNPTTVSSNSTSAAVKANHDSDYHSFVGVDSSFRFRVRAETEDVNSSWAYSGTVHTDPLSPHNPSASRPGPNTIDLSWSNQSDIEDGVEIQYREDTGAGYSSWQPQVTYEWYDTQTYYNNNGHPTTESGFDEFFDTSNSGVSAGGSGTWTNPLAWNARGEPKPSFLPGDGFSFKVTGWIYAPESGTYTVGIDGDDAVDVFIDGTKVASWYDGHGTSGDFSHNGTIDLTTGWHRITARHEEGGGGEALAVGWQKPSDSSFSVIHPFRPGSTTASFSTSDLLQQDARYQFRLRTVGPDGKTSRWAYHDYGNENNVYLADDFEDQDLAEWTTGNEESGSTTFDDGESGVSSGSYGTISSADQGTYYCQLGDSDYIEANPGDLSGETDVIVRFALYTYSNDASNERATVKWYDGSSWHELESWDWAYNREGWLEAQVTVPSSYLGSGNKVRFVGEGGRGGGDHIALDRIAVSDHVHEYTLPSTPSSLSSSTPDFGVISLDWTNNHNTAFSDYYIDIDWQEVYEDGDTDGGQWIGVSSSSFDIPGSNDPALENGTEYQFSVFPAARQFRHGSLSQRFGSESTNGVAGQESTLVPGTPTGGSTTDRQASITTTTTSGGGVTATTATDSVSAPVTSTTSPAATDAASSTAQTVDPFTEQVSTASVATSSTTSLTAPSQAVSAGGQSTGGTTTSIQSPVASTATSSPPATTATTTPTTATASIHLDAPTNVSATVKRNDKIVVSWDDNSGSEDNYHVQMSRDGATYTDPGPSDNSATVSANTTSVTLTPSNDDAYDQQIGIDSNFQFRVRAETEDVDSSWNATSTVYTDPIPPHNPSITRTSDSDEPAGDVVRLDWANQANIHDHVEVQYRTDTGSGYGSWTHAVTDADTRHWITVNKYSWFTRDARYQFRLRTVSPGGSTSQWVYADYGNDGNVYFADDFEDQDLAEWTSTTLYDSSGVKDGTFVDPHASSGGAESNTDGRVMGISGPEQGSYYLFLESGSQVTQTLGDLSSESDVIVKCTMAANSMDSGSESVGLQWYDGAAWNNLERFDWAYNRQGWVEVTARVPSAWLSTDNRLRLDGYGGSGDYYFVDRVVVADICHEYTTPSQPSSFTSSLPEQGKIQLDWTNNHNTSLPDHYIDVDWAEKYTDGDTDGTEWSDSAATSYTIPEGGNTPLENGTTYTFDMYPRVRQDRHGSMSQRFGSPSVNGVSGQNTTLTPAVNDGLGLGSSGLGESYLPSGTATALPTPVSILTGQKGVVQATGGGTTPQTAATTTTTTAAGGTQTATATGLTSTPSTATTETPAPTGASTSSTTTSMASLTTGISATGGDGMATTGSAPSLTTSLSPTDGITQASTGTFRTPTGTGAVTVDDVGFKPDVLVFTVSNSVGQLDQEISQQPGTYGWTHGKAKVESDGTITQNVLSVGSDSHSTNDASGSSKSGYVLDIIIHDDQLTGNVEGYLSSINSNGFDVTFDTVNLSGTRFVDQFLVEYEAYQIADHADAEVGSFLTPTSTGTKTIDLGVKADHVQFTTSNLVNSLDYENAQETDTYGVTHGEVVKQPDGSLSQQAYTQGMEPTNINYMHTAAFDDRALHIIYQHASSVDGRCVGKVTDLGEQLTLDFTEVYTGGYNPGSTDTKLVTYLAVDTGDAYTPEIGYFKTPTSTGTISVSTDFEPYHVELTGMASLNAINTEEVVANEVFGWSHGRVEADNEQHAITHDVHSASTNDHGSRSSSSDSLLNLYLDSNGVISGRDIASTTITDTGFELSFSSVATASDSDARYDQALVFYKAWPAPRGARGVPATSAPTTETTSQASLPSGSSGPMASAPVTSTTAGGIVDGATGSPSSTSPAYIETTTEAQVEASAASPVTVNPDTSTTSPSQREAGSTSSIASPVSTATTSHASAEIAQGSGRTGSVSTKTTSSSTATGGSTSPRTAHPDLLTVQGVTATAGTNKVQNPGFDADPITQYDPAGWTYPKGDSWVTNTERTAPNSTSTQSFGNYYDGRLHDSNYADNWPHAYVYQDIDVSGGETFTASVWVYCASISDSNWTGKKSSKQYVYEDDGRLHLEVYDSSDTKLKTVKTRWAGDAYNRGLDYIEKSGNWFRFEQTIDIPTDGAYLRFQVDGGDGNNDYIDPESGHSGNSGIFIDEAQVQRIDPSTPSTSTTSTSGPTTATASGATVDPATTTNAPASPKTASGAAVTTDPVTTVTVPATVTATTASSVTAPSYASTTSESLTHGLGTGHLGDAKIPSAGATTDSLTGGVETSQRPSITPTEASTTSVASPVSTTTTSAGAVTTTATQTTTAAVTTRTTETPTPTSSSTTPSIGVPRKLTTGQGPQDVQAFIQYEPIVQNGLIGYWSFDDRYTAGDVAIDPLGTNDAVARGAQFEVDGHHREAVSLDGVDDYLAIRDHTYTTQNEITELTVSAWVKLDSDGTVVGYDRSEYYRASSQNFATAEDATGIHDLSTSTNLADGTWHHVVFWYDADASGDSKRVYIDNTVDVSTPSPHNGNGLGTGHATRYGFIGDDSEASSFDGSQNGLYPSGTIDDVRVYNRALSESEIDQLFNATEPFYSATTANTATTDESAITPSKASGEAIDPITGTVSSPEKVLVMGSGVSASPATATTSAASLETATGTDVPPAPIARTTSAASVTAGSTTTRSATASTTTTPATSSTSTTVSPASATVTATSTGGQVGTGTTSPSTGTAPTITTTAGPAGSVEGGRPVVTDGLVSYYSFDSETATLTDNYGTNDGTNAGGSYSGGYTDSGLWFNTGGYGEVPDDSSLHLSNFTVAGWVYISDSTSDWQPIVGRGLKGNRNYGLFVNNGGGTRIHYSFKNTNGNWESFNSSASLNTGEWYFIAMTYDHSAFTLYINGSEDSTNAVTTDPVQTADPLMFGHDEEDAYGYLHGGIDEISIFNKALDHTQISELYNAYASQATGERGITSPLASGASTTTTATVSPASATGSGVTVNPDTVTTSPAAIEPATGTGVTTDPRTVTTAQGSTTASTAGTRTSQPSTTTTANSGRVSATGSSTSARVISDTTSTPTTSPATATSATSAPVTTTTAGTQTASSTTTHSSSAITTTTSQPTPVSASTTTSSAGVATSTIATGTATATTTPAVSDPATTTTGTATRPTDHLGDTRLGTGYLGPKQPGTTRVDASVRRSIGKPTVEASPTAASATTRRASGITESTGGLRSTSSSTPTGSTAFTSQTATGGAVSSTSTASAVSPGTTTTANGTSTRSSTSSSTVTPGTTQTAHVMTATTTSTPTTASPVTSQIAGGTPEDASATGQSAASSLSETTAGGSQPQATSTDQAGAASTRTTAVCRPTTTSASETATAPWATQTADALQASTSASSRPAQAELTVRATPTASTTTSTTSDPATRTTSTTTPDPAGLGHGQLGNGTLPSTTATATPRTPSTTVGIDATQTSASTTSRTATITNTQTTAASGAASASTTEFTATVTTTTTAGQHTSTTSATKAVDPTTRTVTPGATTAGTTTALESPSIARSTSTPLGDGLGGGKLGDGTLPSASVTGTPITPTVGIATNISSTSSTTTTQSGNSTTQTTTITAAETTTATDVTATVGTTTTSAGKLSTAQTTGRTAPSTAFQTATGGTTGSTSATVAVNPKTTSTSTATQTASGSTDSLTPRPAITTQLTATSASSTTNELAPATSTTSDSQVSTGQTATTESGSTASSIGGQVRTASTIGKEAASSSTSTTATLRSDFAHATSTAVNPEAATIGLGAVTSAKSTDESASGSIRVEASLTSASTQTLPVDPLAEGIPDLNPPYARTTPQEASASALVAALTTTSSTANGTQALSTTTTTSESASEPVSATATTAPVRAEATATTSTTTGAATTTSADLRSEATGTVTPTTSTSTGTAGTGTTATNPVLTTRTTTSGTPTTASGEIHLRTPAQSTTSAVTPESATSTTTSTARGGQTSGQSTSQTGTPSTTGTASARITSTSTTSGTATPASQVTAASSIASTASQPQTAGGTVETTATGQATAQASPTAPTVEATITVDTTTGPAAPTSATGQNTVTSAVERSAGTTAAVTSQPVTSVTSPARTEASTTHSTRSDGYAQVTSPGQTVQTTTATRTGSTASTVVSQSSRPVASTTSTTAGVTPTTIAEPQPSTGQTTPTAGSATTTTQSAGIRTAGTTTATTAGPTTTVTSTGGRTASTSSSASATPALVVTVPGDQASSTTTPSAGTATTATTGLSDVVQVQATERSARSTTASATAPSASTTASTTPVPAGSSANARAIVSRTGGDSSSVTSSVTTGARTIVRRTRATPTPETALPATGTLVDSSTTFVQAPTSDAAPTTATSETVTPTRGAASGESSAPKTATQAVSSLTAGASTSNVAPAEASAMSASQQAVGTTTPRSGAGIAVGRPVISTTSAETVTDQAAVTTRLEAVVPTTRTTAGSRTPTIGLTIAGRATHADATPSEPSLELGVTTPETSTSTASTLSGTPTLDIGVTISRTSASATATLADLVTSVDASGQLAQATVGALQAHEAIGVRVQRLALAESTPVVNPATTVDVQLDGQNEVEVLDDGLGATSTTTDYDRDNAVDVLGQATEAVVEADGRNTALALVLGENTATAMGDVTTADVRGDETAAVLLHDGQTSETETVVELHSSGENFVTVLNTL